MYTLPVRAIRPWPCFRWIALALVLCAANANAADAGACARSMVRKTFEYRTPMAKDRDPRGQLPAEMSVEQRRALHPVLWPTPFSTRFSISNLLLAGRFDCVEEAFADLEATHAKYPDGMLKTLSFQAAAVDVVANRNGMTEAEIDDFVQEWRKQAPGSLLAEVFQVRLMTAAAWQVRGADYAQNVPAQRVEEFERLNGVALQRLRDWSPAAVHHVLGKYVALRVIADNGAPHELLAQAALSELAKFPAERGFATLAGQRLLPQWGGSAKEFEKFASDVLRALGPDYGARAYASMYVETVGLDQLASFPMARIPVIEAGLIATAESGTFDSIVALQAFACTRHDAKAMRRARALWATYASQPQLRGPDERLDAQCRDWASRLPPDESSSARTGNEPPPPSFGGMPLAADPSLYHIDSGAAWMRATLPIGELFTCRACAYPVEILVAGGEPFDALASPVTNDAFLATLSKPDDRLRIARLHALRAAGLDPGTMDDTVKVQGADFAAVDGTTAFRYECSTRTRRRTIHETALELIIHGRMLRVLINGVDASSSAADAKAVSDFIAGIKLPS